ncbi:hypothetical protein C2S53_005501 [Perilla frutescens var. hirtella]|uniref:RNase H type-1 domain-containing protein n=1 Tax=Perilla frutescens var. hirtella TaxID=608512 RepID=A0AAD4JDZ6_PERFH|nr:hypothetical protein C2S53_005501 [Perilla frutescens var. hirtella]
MINSIYVSVFERPLIGRCWSPPRYGTLKMNVDAAFKGLNEASIGAIFRDGNGVFTEGFS